MKPYYSFLICGHGDVTNIFYNGLPVGVIRDGVFHVHEFTNLDGSKRPLTMRDLVQPCPFNTLEELQAEIRLTLNRLQIAIKP